MKSIAPIFLSVLVFFACQNEKKETGYVLTGTLKNIADSSVVYLATQNEKMDSAFVVGEKFTMKGKVDAPTHVYISIKDSENFGALWLENSPMTITAEDGKFREAVITGSKTQKDNDLLKGKLTALGKVADSLVSILRDENTEKSLWDSTYAEYQANNDLQQEIQRGFIKENPQSLVSAYILKVYKSTWGKDTTELLFTPMPEAVKNTEDGQSIARFIELSVNPQIGDKYVDFEMENVAGEKVKLSDIKGKYVLVDFWASWCGPCRQENPNLVKTSNNFHDKGFEVLGVSFDQKKEPWLKAIEKDELPWEQITDLMAWECEAGVIYNVNAIPDNILIDEEGTIIARGLRGEKLDEKLEELFNKAS